jgi:3-oxoacyl-[acyl-carrier protein] reductase
VNTNTDKSNPDLTGKVALITGGSKGIGYSVAEYLLRAGMQVAITARSSADVEKATTTLGQLGPVLGLVADVRDESSVQASVDQTLARFGGLDVLVVNAGVGVFKPIQAMTSEEWHSVIDTNLTGAFYSVKAAIPALTERQGYVINISSLAGKNAFAAGAAYNASKFGLNGFSEAIMLDLRALGIKVSYIMPGSVATYFNNHTPTEADAWKIQPEDIAQIVVDLLKMHPRTLPSRVEVRPAQPAKR